MQQQQQPEEDEEPPPLQQSPSSDASCSSPSSTASSSSSSLASPSSGGGGVKEVAASSAAAKILLPPSRTYSATTTTTKIMIDTSSSTSPPHSSTTSCTCPSSLHSLNECSRVYSQCPVCLIKFDAEKPPIALSCSHTICLQCATLLVGIETERQQQQLQSQVVVGRNNNGVVLVMGQQDGIGGGGGGDQHQQRGIVNEALLTFLDGKHTPMPTTNMTNTDPFMRSCNNSTSTTSTSTASTTSSSSATTPPVVASLCRIARLIRSHTVSRSIHRKTILLINSLTPADLDPNATNSKLLKPLKSLGERCLVELTSSCAHVSHYHAQQQLWAAIRARACQFMGPAMQDEALRLVLLALEDGSALSRKVLVMFVVQRLAPQFPQASKTSVGHIVQLLYRASAFDVLKRPGNSSLMTLRAEFRNYEALRREHDTQIMKIGLEAGIRFTPEQYSSLLYGDTSQKPLMQSIIDKLQSPQTFQELLKEYLVSVQRLSNPDQLLVNLHPHFKVLSLIDVGGGGSSQGSGSTDPTCSSTSPPSDVTSLAAAAPPPPTSTHSLPELLDSLHAVLLGLITFTANRKHQRNNGGGGGGAGAGGNNGTGITGSALGGSGDGRLHHHGGPTLTRTASSGGVLQQVHHQPVTASTNSSAAAGLHFTSSGNNKHHAQHSHHHHHQLQHHGSVGYSTGIYPGIGGCGGGQQQLLSRTVSGASATPSSLANNNNHHHHHHHHNSPTNNNNSDNNNANNNNNNVVITTTMMANLCV